MKAKLRWWCILNAYSQFYHLEKFCEKVPKDVPTIKGDFIYIKHLYIYKMLKNELKISPDLVESGK